MKANVGMVYPVAALVDEYTPETSITYENGFVVSEARGANLQWEASDGEFYGDDVLLDNDIEVTGYSIDFEASGLHTGVRATLLGEKSLSDSVYRVTNAAHPDVGFGFVKVMREDIDGVVETRYEGWWFYKLKFSIPSEEARTKERNIEWRVPTLNGRGAGVYLDTSGDVAYADHKDFDSMAAAKTWLETKANFAPVVTT